MDIYNFNTLANENTNKGLDVDGGEYIPLTKDQMFELQLDETQPYRSADSQESIEPNFLEPHFPEKYTKEVSFSAQPFQQNPPSLIIHSGFKEKINCSQNACFENVLKFLKGVPEYENHEIRESSIYGYLFDKSRFSAYRLHFVDIDEITWLVCDNLKGDNFVTVKLWKQLKGYLSNQGLCAKEDQFESDEEEDYLTDEEVEDLDLGVEEENFLMLKNDPKICSEWLNDLKHPNFFVHTILLMAWNLKNIQNLMAFINQGSAQLLFEAIIELLDRSEALVVVRGCAKVLLNLLKVQNLELVVCRKQVQILITKILMWSPLEESRDMLISQSEEVLGALSQTVTELFEQKLIEKKDLKSCRNQIAKVCNVTSNAQTTKLGVLVASC